eukprot:766209-Hanusia_phi.AAC.4
MAYYLPSGNGLDETALAVRGEMPAEVEERGAYPVMKQDGSLVRLSHRLPGSLARSDSRILPQGHRLAQGLEANHRIQPHELLSGRRSPTSSAGESLSSPLLLLRCGSLFSAAK